MAAVINVLIIIASILLILIVLVQNSKGGGLASNFSASNQVMGVKKTTEFVEKATWTLVIVLVVLCMSATHFAERKQVVSSSVLEEQVETAAPALPEGAPVAPSAE